MKFKTRNTYKRHLRTRHGKELVSDGVRMMPREQFLLVRTKPYLHDDQTTPDDILETLLMERGDLAVVEPLVIAPQSPSAEYDADGPMTDEPTSCNDATVVKSEPL